MSHHAQPHLLYNLDPWTFVLHFLDFPIWGLILSDSGYLDVRALANNLIEWSETLEFL